MRVQALNFDICSLNDYRSPTLGVWFGTLAIAVVYMTDWKVVMGKIPYVKGRFSEDSDSDK